jgi:hypothetical protein
MMVCIICNFAVALVSFVLYTFIYPPRLQAGAPPQHPLPASTTDTSNRDQTAAGTASSANRNILWSRKESKDARSPHHLDSQPSPFERQAGQRADVNKPHRKQMQLTDMAPIAGGAGRIDSTGVDQQFKGEGAGANQEQSGLAPTGGLLKSLPGMLKVWVKGLPAWFSTAVLEEEDIK